MKKLRNPFLMDRGVDGERSDNKGIYLLMMVTGLAVGDFLPREFLQRLGRRR